MKRIIYTAVAALAVLTGGIAAAAPAMAATTPTPKITGSFSLANPTQYESVNAFVGDKGSVSYTNFTYADQGSGVWSLHSNIAVNFGLDGAPYPHTMVVDSISPTGLASFDFTGHGSYVQDPSYTWTAKGSVSGTSITLHITYTGSNKGYAADATGTIAADGSVSGSATSSTGQDLSMAMPAGSAFEALSYTAPVSGVQVSGSDGQFSAAIPAGHVLAGTAFTVKVHDGGSPGAGNDTYAQDGTSYTIAGGNLTVH